MWKHYYIFATLKSTDAPNSVQAQERNDDNDYRAAMESWQQQNYRENGAGVNCSAIRHHHKSGGHGELLYFSACVERAYLFTSSL